MSFAGFLIKVYQPFFGWPACVPVFLNILSYISITNDMKKMGHCHSIILKYLL